MLIGQHEMAMIRPHGHAVVFSSFITTAFLLEQKYLHHTVHIHVAFQMIDLDEIALAIPGNVAEMDEFDPFCKILCHVNKIIVKAGAE